MLIYKENEAKDITLALAHEVKNPISVIKANIEFLELDEMSTNYKKNFKVIKKELDKICDIMSDFILLSNCNYNNNYKIYTNYINVYNIIKECIEKFDVYKHIKFDINCYPDIKDLIILSDSSKITIVLSNVYKNCIEAIKHKKGLIQTDIYRENDDIILEIIDNGEGIKEDILDKIYTPFFTSKEGGSGLGIPICINTMMSLNGDFLIYNNKDVGCTTKIILKHLL